MANESGRRQSLRGEDLWKRDTGSDLTMDNQKAVIMDNGTGFLKAGLAGDKEPSVMFPAVVGKKKPNCREHRERFTERIHYHSRASLADHYTGEDAMTQRPNVTLRHPLEKGVVNQWAEMEMLWDHAYQRLRTKPAQQAVLVTESVLNPEENRRRTVETLLETYKVPAVIVADTPSLCLFADGATTGLVLESGYSATYAVPIIKGEVMHRAVTRLDLGGNDLTVFLLRLVEARGYFFPPAKREMFAEVKEKLCYVAMDYAMEELAVTKFAGTPQSTGIKQSYNLAGDTITLATERFQCPESLFQPDWLRVDAVGVHRLVYDAIDKCPRDWHEELYGNILVTGGCTRFPGFLERLQAEMSKLCPDVTDINIRLPDNNRTLAWRGGAELANSSKSESKWITLKEYQEVGPDIIERKRGVFSRERQDAESEEKANRDAQRDKAAEYGDQVGASATPHTMYRKRQVMSSSTTTPSLFGSSATPSSGPYHSHTSTPGGGFRGGKLFRGTPSDPAGVTSRGSSLQSRENLAHSSVLTTRKIVDEKRPVSPGAYDKTFVPTLTKTPEQGVGVDVDAEGEDDLPPLRSSAKTKQPAAGSGSAATEGNPDFNSFRKLSLFDHLLDEVSTFGARAAVQQETEEGDVGDDNDDSVSWTSRKTQDSSLLDKMRDDELLPGRGRSGLRRNESINIEELKKPASAVKVFGDRGGHAVNGFGKAKTMDVPDFRVLGVQKLPPIPLGIPDIEITTCPTPHGSASSKVESDNVSQTVGNSPRKIKFKFKQ